MTVQPPAAGGTITNNADLNYVADTLNTPNIFRVPPVTTPVAALADLSVTKTVTPDPVLAGATVTLEHRRQQRRAEPGGRRHPA